MMGYQEPSLRPGKLPQKLLEQMLSVIDRRDQRVRLWPSIGEDATAIDFGDTSLIAASDPVTFASDLIGWYAVHVNANDIAACGGEPRWFMATVLLPDYSSSYVPSKIFNQIREASESLNVSVVGGHTEITQNVKMPIVSGVMLGEASANAPISTTGVQVGDDILLTKGVAIEGTALLAREMPSQLRAAGMSRKMLEKAANYLFDPGISVLSESRIARTHPGVHAMHDPTEGGLATGLYELASAAKVGILVNTEAVNIYKESDEVCKRLGISPWGLLASGALLIAVSPAHSDQLVRTLSDAGIGATIIAKATRQSDGLQVIKGQITSTLPIFSRDEISRLL